MRHSTLAHRGKTFLLTVLTVLLALGVLSGTAYTLTLSVQTTTAQRNAVAYNWSYYTRGYYENNCLAYALGNTTSWIWPWGSTNPTVAAVDVYMSGKGYAAIPPSACGPYRATRAYAFGSTSGVTHFAKNTGISSTFCVRNDPIRAKWGHCEVFNHSYANPYKTTPYGPLVRVYVK